MNSVLAAPASDASQAPPTTPASLQGEALNPTSDILLAWRQRRCALTAHSMLRSQKLSPVISGILPLAADRAGSAHGAWRQKVWSARVLLNSCSSWGSDVTTTCTAAAGIEPDIEVVDGAKRTLRKLIAVVGEQSLSNAAADVAQHIQCCCLRRHQKNAVTRQKN